MKTRNNKGAMNSILILAKGKQVVGFVEVDQSNFFQTIVAYVFEIVK